jgi:hypothetical protein
MNLENNQTATGSIVTMAQHVQNELRRSGTISWLGFPTPEEMEQLRAERAERHFQKLKWRMDAKNRRHEEMRQALKRGLQRRNAVTSSNSGGQNSCPYPPSLPPLSV